MARLHAVVRGRVQGVGFRWFVRERARQLGARGWVKNRPDGCVELEADGEPDSVDRLRELLFEGPPGAHVTTVDELPAATPTGELPYPFSIIR